MAVVTRYFSTSGAGASDGTTWSDRAPFVSGGLISSLVRGFDFTSDALVARIGSGNYDITTALSVFTGAAVPTQAFSLYLEACDTSGNLWVPPNGSWVSSQPVWDTSTMPVLATSGNINTISQSFIHCRGLRFQASGATSASPLNSCAGLDWCVIEYSASGSAVLPVSAVTQYLTNSVIDCSASPAYSTCTGAVPNLTFDNVRLLGNASASSGNRRGWSTANNAAYSLSRVASINNVGGGLLHTGTGTGAGLRLRQCLVTGSSAGSAVALAGTSSNPQLIENSVLVNSSIYGFDNTGTSKVIAFANRLRDNASGNFNGLGSNNPDFQNEISSGTDSSEFVNSSSGDYRIKNTSSIWGKGYGPGDEQIQGSGSTNGGSLLNSRLLIQTEVY